MKQLHESLLTASQHVPFLTPDEAYGVMVIGGLVAGFFGLMFISVIGIYLTEKLLCFFYTGILYIRRTCFLEWSLRTMRSAKKMI